MDKWHRRFLELAQYVATWSKDPRTKVGAVIVDDQRRIVGHGYNGFPRGVDDAAERYDTPELKYEMVVHAETNAVLNAGRSVAGCTVYVTFFPCPRCAAYLIQAGISQVIALTSPSDDRYVEMRRIAEQMLQEAGVAAHTVPLETLREKFPAMLPVHRSTVMAVVRKLGLLFRDYPADKETHALGNELKTLLEGGNGA